jgi:hypothetical protein
VVFRPLDAAVVRYDPIAVLEELDTARLVSGPRLERTLTNFALLKSAVPDFPVATLASARERADRVTYANVNWLAIERLNRDGTEAARAGKLADALAAFERSLSVAAEQLHVLTAVAMIKSKMGDHDGALAAWRLRDALEPGDPQTLAAIERELAVSRPRRAPRRAPAPPRPLRRRSGGTWGTGAGSCGSSATRPSPRPDPG